MKNAIIAIIWICCGIAGSGFINAHFRAVYPDVYSSSEWAKREGRLDIAMGVISGPIFLVTSYLWTGFGSDGWTLSTEPTEPWARQ